QLGPRHVVEDHGCHLLRSLRTSPSEKVTRKENWTTSSRATAGGKGRPFVRRLAWVVREWHRHLHGEPTLLWLQGNAKLAPVKVLDPIVDADQPQPISRCAGGPRLFVKASPKLPFSAGT